MKNFTLKDNRAIQVTLERNSYYCQIDAVDACDQHNVGRLIFKHRGGKAFLCTIAVTDKDYLQAGVGSIMLQCFESYCKSKRIEVKNCYLCTRWFRWQNIKDGLEIALGRLRIFGNLVIA